MITINKNLPVSVNLSNEFESSQRIDRMRGDEISGQDENFVFVYQNNNNHINIINHPDIEDSSELTTTKKIAN